LTSRKPTGAWKEGRAEAHYAVVNVPTRFAQRSSECAPYDRLIAHELEGTRSEGDESSVKSARPFSSPLNPRDAPQEQIRWILSTQILEELRTFPHPGNRRDDIREDLRVKKYRKRGVVVLDVDAEQVYLIGVFYGGQDYETVLQGDTVDW